MFQPVNDSFPTLKYFLSNQLTKETAEETKKKRSATWMESNGFFSK